MAETLTFTLPSSFKFSDNALHCTNCAEKFFSLMEATQHWTEETQAGTVRSSNDFESNCNTENITWVDLLPEMLDFTEDSVKGTETDPVDPDEKIIDNKILEAAPNDRFVVEESVKIEPELMTIRIRKVDHEFFLNTKLEIFNPVDHPELTNCQMEVGETQNNK